MVFVMRIKFKRGRQRKFLDLVVERLSSPSLRGILQFGFDVPYSTLKSYYSESRLLPEGLFWDLLEASALREDELRVERVDENWGKIKGGKISRR